MYADFTLTPLALGAGPHIEAQVRFDCNECGHTEFYGRMRYTDVAHVLGSDHYREDCPELRTVGEEHPQITPHRAAMRAAYLLA